MYRIIFFPHQFCFPVDEGEDMVVSDEPIVTDWPNWAEFADGYHMIGRVYNV